MTLNLNYRLDPYLATLRRKRKLEDFLIGPIDRVTSCFVLSTKLIHYSERLALVVVSTLLARSVLYQGTKFLIPFSHAFRVDLQTLLGRLNAYSRTKSTAESTTERTRRSLVDDVVRSSQDTGTRLQV
jgi:hypothetical protein